MPKSKKLGTLALKTSISRSGRVSFCQFGGKAEAGLSPATRKGFKMVAAIVSITLLLVLFAGIYVAKKLARRK